MEYQQLEVGHVLATRKELWRAEREPGESAYREKSDKGEVRVPAIFLETLARSVTGLPSSSEIR